MSVEPEYLERLVRIESRLDTLIEFNERLQEDRAKGYARLEALEDFKHTLIERIAWITGAFTVVASGLGYFAKEILDYIHNLLWSN